LALPLVVLLIFSESTLVFTGDEFIAIKDIKKGTLIKTIHGDNAKMEEFLVIKKYTKIISKLVLLTVEEDVISSAEKQAFYTNKGWVSAKDIQVDDLLFNNEEEWLKVSKVEFIDSVTIVHHIGVDKAHTFFVGKEKILVHTPHLELKHEFERTTVNEFLLRKGKVIHTLGVPLPNLLKFNDTRSGINCSACVFAYIYEKLKSPVVASQLIPFLYGTAGMSEVDIFMMAPLVKIDLFSQLKVYKFTNAIYANVDILFENKFYHSFLLEKKNNTNILLDIQYASEIIDVKGDKICFNVIPIIGIRSSFTIFGKQRLYLSQIICEME